MGFLAKSFTWINLLFFIHINAYSNIINLTDDAYFNGKIKENKIEQSPDSITGSKSIKVTGRNFYDEKIPGWNYKITSNPKNKNEFRYILFMWKQKGGRSMMIQLANDYSWPRALSYTAGEPGNTLFKTRLSSHAPSEWVIVIRDLYQDMINAQFESNFDHNKKLETLAVTGLALIPWDCEYGLWDGVYLGTDKNELEKMAYSLRTLHNRKFTDHIMELKDKIDNYNRNTFAWEEVTNLAGEYGKLLNENDKKFLGPDFALSYSWLALESFMRDEKSDHYFSEAFKYFDQAGIKYGQWNISSLKRLLDKRKEMKMISPEYIQKIGLILIKEIHADGLTSSFTGNESRKFKIEWNIIKQLVELFSNGRLSLEVEIYYHGGSYYGLAKRDPLVPDLTSVRPFPSDLLFKLAKNSDVMAYCYPAEYYPSTGGMGNFTIIPGKLDSPKRGMIGLNRGHFNPDDFMLGFHEYIHALEFHLGLKSMHEYRAYSEYRDDPFQAELDYYEKLFAHYIPEALKNNGYEAFSWHEAFPLLLTGEEFEKLK